MSEGRTVAPVALPKSVMVRLGDGFPPFLASSFVTLDEISMKTIGPMISRKVYFSIDLLSAFFDLSLFK